MAQGEGSVAPMISPLEGEMAAKRPEGVAAREAPTFFEGVAAVG